MTNIDDIVEEIKFRISYKLKNSPIHIPLMVIIVMVCLGMFFISNSLMFLFTGVASTIVLIYMIVDI